MVHFHHLLKTKKKDKMKTEIPVFMEIAGSAGSISSVLAPGAEEAVRGRSLP